jgi:AsmA family protein
VTYEQFSFPRMRGVERCYIGAGGDVMTDNSRPRRVAKWFGIAALIVVAGILFTVALVDWNDMRGPIERIASARAGRPVRITGDLDMKLFSLTPRATINGLELGNLPWANASTAHVDRLDVRMRLLPPRKFSLDVTSGGTQINARGTAPNPFALGSYRTAVTMSGRDLGDLYYLTGFATPNTPPYKFSAHVNGTGKRLVFNDVVGQIGKSDIRGKVEVDARGARRHIMADLESRSLDLVDLAPAFGATADDRPSPRVFPDARLEASRLRMMDGTLRFRAGSIRTRKLPLREVALNLELDEGVLVADPFTFTLPQGTLTGRARLDATGDVPNTEIDARLTGVKLEQFKPRTAKKSPLEGVLRGRIRLSGSGDSVHALVSNADGNITAIVPQGEIREAFAELTGINIARGLGLLLTKDQEQTGVRCGVADFQLRDGTLHAKNLVFDTDDVRIDGSGKIDLAKEQFDLSIQGHPKKLRLFRLKSPITVRGPLRKPDVGIEGKEALKQTGIAAALSAVAAPLAAVIAFVDPGLADDANCSKLLATAKRDGAPVKTAEITKAKKR